MLQHPDFRQLLASEQYEFLRTNPKIAGRIILIGLGGSYAYGTNTETSDVDIRGIALNTRSEILLGKDYETVVDTNTDTTIYSFRKMISLLAACNPNVIEILGLRQQDYLYLDDAGIAQMLIDNAHLFLSKRVLYTFGGYAHAQLRRLQNKAARGSEQAQREEHIRKSIEHASLTFKEQVQQYPDDAIRLYVDRSEREEMDTEMFVDLSLKHYPLRDLSVLYSDVNSIIQDYDKIGHRNHNAMTHAKIAKHSMHLVRLFFMAIDILEREEVRTYREDEHDLLMSIRNGAYLNESGEPTKEFFDLVDELSAKLDEAARNTRLQERVDMTKIEALEEKVAERIVLAFK